MHTLLIMMYLRFSLLVFFCLFSITISFGQSRIQGRVLDFDTKEPLVAASVYLNNTTQGVFTDEKGNFELPYNPNYNEVVVSFVGYETLSYFADLASTQKRLTFLSKPLPEIIDEVSITSSRSPAWKGNFRFFHQCIIGISENGSNTKILNPEAVYFDINKATGQIKAFAREPIVIENNALGYKLEYALIEFSYNPRTSELLYVGNPKFTPLEGSKRKNKRWDKRRDRAYKGSFVHFANAIKSGDYKSEGFQVNRIKRVPNPDRPPQSVLDSLRRSQISEEYPEGIKIIRLGHPLDSISRLERLPKYVEYLDKEPLDPTQFIEITDKGMSLAFPDYWQVLYKKESMDSMYRVPGELGRPSPNAPQTSLFHLLADELKFNELGIVNNPLAVRFEGYWAFEKLPYLLPFDFEPEE